MSQCIAQKKYSKNFSAQDIYLKSLARTTLALVKFAIPKGSIEDATFKVLERSWTKVRRRDRTYRVTLDDPQIAVKMLRPQEIPNLVFDGLYDVCITSQDWVQETKSFI